MSHMTATLFMWIAHVEPDSVFVLVSLMLTLNERALPL